MEAVSRGVLASLVMAAAACSGSHGPVAGADAGSDGARVPRDGALESDATPAADGAAPDSSEVWCVPGSRGACGEGAYCAGPDFAQCGGKDIFAGTCQARPLSCDAVLSPVCGCDGMDYDNACLAQQAGVDALPGACPLGPACTAVMACAPGLTCVGGVACTDRWFCAALDRACTDDLAPYCGCDGATFYDSSTCPRRPYAHMGECETMPEASSCDPRDVTCTRVPMPDCPEGYAPRVLDGCWNGCVPLSTCSCTQITACPTGYCCYGMTGCTPCGI